MDHHLLCLAKALSLPLSLPHSLSHSLSLSLSRFSNNKIIRAYSIVLADYNTNSDAINHAVVKMLYRIAVQLKMAPLLYQITIFSTFLEILSEPPVPRMKVGVVRSVDGLNFGVNASLKGLTLTSLSLSFRNCRSSVGTLYKVSCTCLPRTLSCL